MKKFKLGINACRAKSGGMRTHLHGILSNVDNEFLKSCDVIIWGYPELVEEFSVYQDIRFITNKYLSRRLLHQVFWELYLFKRELMSEKVDVLLSLDGTNLVTFDRHIVMSRDMLSYEPGILGLYRIGYSKLRIILIKFIQNRAFRRATCVIFLTQYAKDIIIKSCGEVSDYSIIPHGVSRDFLNAGNQRLNTASPIRDILYTSTIDIYKNQWNVVEAVSKLRTKGYELNLHLVGGAVNQKAFEMTCDAIAKYDPKGTFVFYHGHLTHDELSKLMLNMDLFCFASGCETMPNTLIEAMSFGLPVVCSSKGPMPEVLKDAGIYFNPYVVNDIVSAIERVCNGEVKLDLMSEKAKSYSEFYSWKICANKTFDLVTREFRQKTIK